MNKQLTSVIFMTLFFPFSLCERCDFRSACQYVFQNGSIIDLTSLGYHDQPRFENVKPMIPDNSTFFYNPCFSFKKSQACSKGVAVCRFLSNQYENYGDSDYVDCSVEKDSLVLQYTGNPTTKKTKVTLVCSEEFTTPTLDITGKTEGSDEFNMILTSRCACPDLCHASHLSTGSVLVIIFMIFVALYLVLGIVHSNLTRGAHGWELIPHYEFWADFPLLVRDGCVFVVSGCKPETAYERI